jgi:hemoglobin
MRTPLLALFIGFTAVLPAAAQDPAAQDKLLSDALKEMHNKGADLYNSGDANGCYRIFQGGLYTARPLLSHRPDLQQVIDDGLQAADRQASVAIRARTLHDTIEAIRTKLRTPAASKPSGPTGTPTPSLPQAPPSPPPSPAASPPVVPPGPVLPNAPSSPTVPAVGDTLWKRLGGEDGVTKIVDNWLTLALADKRVNLTRGDKVKLDNQKQADLKLKLVAYMSSITNGTIVPTKSRTMAEIHTGMNITDAEFEAFVGCLKTALETNNVSLADTKDVIEKVSTAKKEIVPGN